MCCLALARFGSWRLWALVGVGVLAGHQEFADPAAELLTAVEPDQPGSGQAGTPFAVEQRGELVVADLARTWRAG